MSELFLVVSLKAKMGKENALRHDLKVVTEESRKEDGSISYDLFVDQNDPGRFLFLSNAGLPGNSVTSTTMKVLIFNFSKRMAQRTSSSQSSLTS
ncbi:putative quinol monooxygenase [Brucella grignonensis]|uniref:putative quinol monooxygenase n=1 Tax=Brucella grignonensis TaxID=94627 RepID=UPI001ABF00E9|nr:antibiotic biosynthesis monooxygenase [Brucella grignonensis]